MRAISPARPNAARTPLALDAATGNQGAMTELDDRADAELYLISPLDVGGAFPDPSGARL